MADHVTIGLTRPEGPDGAPLLVLGHSLGTGPLIWEKVVPLLSQDYRVSLLTLPGHGEVPVPDAPFTLDELGDAVAAGVKEIASGPAYYAGVSIGGAVALTLAIRHADQFRAVACISALASMGGEQHWAERAAKVRKESTSSLVADSAERWFAPGSIENQPDLSGRILRVLQNTPDEGYARCAEALGTYDVSSELSQIAAPVLLVAGQHDPVAPPEAMEALSEEIPGSQITTIDDAGHQPPAEQPGAMYQTLTRFFEEVS